MKRTAQLVGPIVAYMAVIFFLSSRPHLPVPRFPGFDKLAHFSEYFVLGALSVRAALGYGVRIGRALGAAVAFCALYAGLDELHQAFVPCRVPAADDFVADILGASTGVLSWYALCRLRAQKVESAR